MPSLVEVEAPTVIKPAPVDTDAGDHDRFAHYVHKSKIAASYIEGTPVVALCGKKWVPSRDPKKFPICPECKEIHRQLSE